jgi:hypothetical protein
LDSGERERGNVKPGKKSRSDFKGGQQTNEGTLTKNTLFKIFVSQGRGNRERERERERERKRERERERERDTMSVRHAHVCYRAFQKVRVQ